MDYTHLIWFILHTQIALSLLAAAAWVGFTRSRYSSDQYDEPYECGFKTLQTRSVLFSFHNYLPLCFLLLYELEFVLLLPLYTHRSLLKPTALMLLILVLCIVIGSFFLDVLTKQLTWKY